MDAFNVFELWKQKALEVKLIPKFSLPVINIIQVCFLAKKTISYQIFLKFVFPYKRNLFWNLANS